MSKLKLLVLKPLQAKWIMDLFNYLTSEKGRGIISNDWKAAFITETICSGLKCLEPLDPFQAIDPMATENSNTGINIPFNNDVDFFVTCKSFEEGDDVWEDLSGEGGEDVNGEDGEDVNSISDIIDNIMEEN